MLPGTVVEHLRGLVTETHDTMVLRSMPLMFLSHLIILVRRDSTTRAIITALILATRQRTFHIVLGSVYFTILSSCPERHLLG